VTEHEPKPVSPVPLVSNQPLPRRGNNLLLLFILACLVAVVGGGVWIWLDASRPEHDPHVTRWGREYSPDDFPYGDDKGDYQAAKAHMQKLADALNAYREGPIGGGVRWPSQLDELQMAGLLEPEFEFGGLLSGKPIAYQPEMPIGHDPERWVLCHDIEIGWRRQQATGYAMKGPRAAVVMLADGTVKLLEGDELELYGGLNLQVGAGR
jgi:hypothetical protein